MEREEHWIQDKYNDILMHLTCSEALYNVIISDSDLLQSSTNLISQGSIQPMLPLKAQSNHVLSGSYFYGWVNQSPHDNIAAPGASNPRPFGYESYVLTNCAITSNEDQRLTIDKLYLNHHKKINRYWNVYSILLGTNIFWEMYFIAVLMSNWTKINS